MTQMALAPLSRTEKKLPIDMKLLALVPAAVATKGVPRKNIRDLLGRPLLAWSIEAANQAAGVDRIVVSTEDEEIADVAEGVGADVPFLRPSELATRGHAWHASGTTCAIRTA